MTLLCDTVHYTVVDKHVNRGIDYRHKQESREMGKMGKMITVDKRIARAEKLDDQIEQMIDKIAGANNSMIDSLNEFARLVREATIISALCELQDADEDEAAEIINVNM